MNKTDAVLKIIMNIKSSKNDYLTKEEMWKLLGGSRANNYRIIAELLKENSFRPAVLVKVEQNDIIFYTLTPAFK
jgi:hypothetical protein